MADTWWRFYNTAPDHPKIVTLSDAQFRAWATLNCLASKMGGEFDDNIAVIAAAMRKPAGKARELLQVLLSARLLDRTESGGYRPHNWDEKQFKSDSSTDRVKRHRERKRNGDETFHVTENETVVETDQRQRQIHRQKEDARMARFQEFWEACPKRTGRGAAERAWFKATSLVEPETIIAAMRAYARTQIGKDPAYTKTPGPWLNEKRWADEGLSPPPAVFENTNERGWSDRLRVFREQGIWAAKFGPRPGEPGCKCPPEILNSEAA